MYDDFWGGHKRPRRERQQGRFDIAQICLNGHVINSTCTIYPEYNKTHCDTCGSKTITQCQSCDAIIKGEHYTPGYSNSESYHKPAFCDNCGKPYSWTQRTQKAANELIEFSTSLTQQEKDDFKNSVTDLMVQSPKTTVAQVKVSTYLKKAGVEVAKGIKDVLVDVVSETVKKAIWG